MAIPEFIQRLLDPASHGLAAGQTQLVETHISWVVIAAGYAYKVKKPVRFEFADFSTPELRRHYCEEELRLNRRFAPQTYLDVVEIAPGEWAVKMKAFDTRATLNQQAAVSENQIDAIADAIWGFQSKEPPVLQPPEAGTPDQISRLVHENVIALERRMEKRLPESLRQWLIDATDRLGPAMAARKRDGYIRDGHGDLHLANIAWSDDGPIIFDCIEFSPALRQNDIISEIAFLAMDLHARGQPEMAWRLLNRWLEHSGDFDGLELLGLYLVHRSLVRAKVSLLQNKPLDLTRYLDLADRFIARPPAVFLGLMHGFSGSGKTFWSEKIMQHHGAIRLRSDVERRRIANGWSSREANLNTSPDQERYGPEMTARVFDAIAKTATRLLAWKFPVIVDATFLNRQLRQGFIKLGVQHGVSVTIIDVKTSPDACRARIQSRSMQPRPDASEATLEVLEKQLLMAEALDPNEQALAVSPQEMLERAPIGMRRAP